MAREILSYRLNSIHNLSYYLRLMRDIRQAIHEDRLIAFREYYIKKQKTDNC